MIRSLRAQPAAALIACALALASCSKETGHQEPPRLGPLKVEPAETQQYKRDEPPHVKLKRDRDGGYSWEISGKDVKGITEADRALRGRLGQPKNTEE